MAYIDKTYTDSYKDYKEFKDWADKQVVTFYDGHKEKVGNWVWFWEEEDFSNGEIPIMNTPYWLDAYLIQNCKSEFVLDRMKEVYGEDSYEEAKKVDLAEKPHRQYKQNRKIIISRNKYTKYSIHSKPYGGGMHWWLQSSSGFSYNNETKTWTDNHYYPTNTNTAHISSVKAVIRHLRKQYLPSEITFTLMGRYVGEDYTIKIK